MRIITYIVLVLCVLGCKNNAIDKPEKPDNLIDKDKMVDVLYDMALMSSAKGVGKRTLENKGVNPEAFIYEKHNIDSIQFKQSNAYYAYDIDTYEAIYEKVKLKLDEDKKDFQAIIDEEKRKRDSIAKRSRKQDSIARLKREQKRKDSLNNSNPDRLNKDDKSQQ